MVQKMDIGHAIFAVICVVHVTHAWWFRGPTVETTEGGIQGRSLRSNGRNVEAFLGIPYAKPPVGDLRFKAPVPPERRRRLLQTKRFPKSCYQILEPESPGFSRVGPRTVLSEDCLYLNIWRPKRRSSGWFWGYRRQRVQKYATIVYFVGGSFVRGDTSPNLYNGATLAATGNVIVVTFNSRLGSLGFMYGGSEQSPGNMALLDQAQMLQWLQNNIESFGGDKEKITLLGQSSGAIAASLHLLSPKSSNLFNNVILQSSSFFARAILPPDVALNRSRDLAVLMNCSDSEGGIDFKCMRAADPQVLVNLGEKVAPSFEIGMQPVVDGVFLPDSPLTLLQTGQAKKANVLMGVDEDEYGSFLGNFGPLFNPLPEEKPSLNRDVLLQLVSVFVGPVAAQGITSVYESMTEQPIDYTDLLLDMFSDSFFKCPVVLLGQAYSSFGNVYMYSMNHPNSMQPFPQWLGALHSFELEFVFGDPLRRGGYTSDEVALSKKIISLWTNFAKTGNPNTNGGDVWPLYTSANQSYLILDVGEQLQSSTNLRSQACAFWATFPF